MKVSLFVLPFILLSLLTAIWTGWQRIGWDLPLTNATGHHGSLMVGSFLATLIFLERCVTFKNKWILLLPIINGLSAVFFITKNPLIAQILLIAGSAGFFIMCCYFIYKFKEFYYYFFLLGAFTLVSGNIILFKTNFYPNAVPWWIGFFLFTIVAERIELSRFLPLNNLKKNTLTTILVLFLISLFLPFHSYGRVIFAIALALAGLWLLKFDMARLSLKIKGQHRYSAILLLTGFAWLLVTALLFIAGNELVFFYDAALHSFFIGFVFSMIFSHAPIILPAVLKMPVKIYRPVLYIWVALLQLSLITRIVAAITGDFDLRKWSGILNGVVILLFFVSVAITLLSEKRKNIV
jgi:hypothetical protein